MTDILNFPGRLKDSRQEFLRGEDETLQFDADCKVASLTMPVSNETQMAGYGVGYGAPKNRYWSNQELASLFRVKRLLDAAGIVCDVDYDCTDEGDPWFVFCDAAGEVFIHLCRIDGKYLLDSPNIFTPLTGWDFSELIEGFLQRNGPQESHPAASTATGSGQRVVRFERNGKVFMHPATMLAALIWTLFLESEDLVMLLPESTDAQTKAVNDLTQTFHAEDNTVEESAGKSASEHISPDATDATGATLKPAESHPLAQFMRDMHSQNDDKFNYNTYAIGLSALAIAAGFISDVSFPEINPTDLSGILDALLDGDAAAEVDGNERAFTDLDGATVDFVTFIQEVFGDVVNVANSTAPAENTTDASNEAMNADSFMFQLHLANLVKDVTQDATALFTIDTQKSAAGLSQTEPQTDKTQLITPDGTMAQTYADAIVEADDSSLSIQYLLARFALSGERDAWQSDLKTMTVQNTQIHATFDVTENVLEKTNSLLAKASDETEPLNMAPIMDDDKIGFKEAPKTGPESYDEYAEIIAQSIMDNAKDLEIIKTKGKVMFFDSSIINADVDDVMVFSWSLENGDIVAAMGLRSQLESADLIM